MFNSKVIVMSQAEAEKISFTPPFAMISITSLGAATFPWINADTDDSLFRLNFLDTDEKESSISQEEAIRLAKFIKKWYPKVKKFIVHCEAGVSRSAGVAAAILKYFENDDSPIFDNAYFKPNMYVYRSVLDALYSID